MRIDHVESNRRRLTARIVWEDCGRPDDELFFEVQGADLPATPGLVHDALLTALAVPAMHHGEHRVWIGGDICPTLYQGLSSALLYLRRWFYPPQSPALELAVPLRAAPLPSPGVARRAGVFFSGGVDSLATLECNHRDYAVGYPERITDGIVVRGFEVVDSDAFGIAERHLRAAAEVAGLELMTVHTNLYSLFRPNDPYLEFLIQQFEGAFFSSIAQLLGERLFQVRIATTLDIAHLEPNGSHPLLDYSSSSMRMIVDGVAMTRFEKARTIAETSLARSYLRVCNRTQRYEVGRINCGECNKCVGTMLMFEALGTLEGMSAFDPSMLTPSGVRAALTPRVPFQQSLCRELIPALVARGRSELAEALVERLRAFGGVWS